MACRGMFCRAAMARASGLALTRPPSADDPVGAWAATGWIAVGGAAGAAGGEAEAGATAAGITGAGGGGGAAGAGAACGAGAGGGAATVAGAAGGAAAGTGAGGAGAGAGAGADGGEAVASIAEMSSSGPAMTPMSVPTGALPPAGTSTLRRMPSPRASISMFALSVSISATTSPTLTASPSFLIHLTMVPSSMVGESLARTTLVTLMEGRGPSGTSPCARPRPPSPAGAGTPSPGSWRRAWVRRRR